MDIDRKAKRVGEQCGSLRKDLQLELDVSPPVRRLAVPHAQSKTCNLLVEVFLSGQVKSLMTASIIDIANQARDWRLSW